MAQNIPADVDKHLQTETDMRFWASTGYKPGQKLDPSADKAMVPVWLKIYDTVKSQWQSGTLTWSSWKTGAPPTPTPTPLEVVTKAMQQPAPSVPTPHPAVPHPVAAHPSAPPSRPSIDAATQDKLYREANARFWAQTGYRPGEKLDPSKRADQAMMPVWTDIYKKVENAYRAGNLQYTYDHPIVTAGLDDARAQAQAAADALAAATRAQAAGMQDEARARLAAATAAHDAALAAAKSAAYQQPPTASPELAHAAGHQVQQFVMNGGTGVPVGSPEDAVAAMQATGAGGRVAAGAALVPSGSTDPAADLSSHADSGGKGKWIGIGLAAVATLGLGYFAAHQHGLVRRGRNAPHRRAMRFLGAGSPA